VHETVNLARRFGHQGMANYVNAVLRRVVDREFQYPSFESDPVSHIAVMYSHPYWLVKRWIEKFGVRETRDLCCANNRIPDLVVRVNVLKVSLGEALSVLINEDIEAQPSPSLSGYIHVRQAGNLLKHETFQGGWFTVQDESAGFASLLLDPKPGERVLDMCCAPGGKTTHVAQLMHNRGTLLAVDINEEKLGLVEENCRRLGIEMVNVIQGDGTSFESEAFDRVLVDAPCSGTGVFARRVDSRWRKTERQVMELRNVQKRLFENAVKLLKRGGVLVYSTCSLEEEENEGVVDDILKSDSGLQVEDAGSFVPKEYVTARGFVRTFPHRHGMDGSFAVRLRKKN
jgi:16S rRNA (cytosine967-C5)-methyltransferase